MTTPEAAQLEALDWRELLRAARSLLQPDNGASPSNECIRRAISNAYYAMFHALAASNAGVIVGPPHDDLTAEAWIRVYRGLRPQYGQARIPNAPTQTVNQRRQLRRRVHRPPGQATLSRLRPSRSVRRAKSICAGGLSRVRLRRIPAGRPGRAILHRSPHDDRQASGLAPPTSPRAATQPAHAVKNRFLKPADGLTAAKA